MQLEDLRIINPETHLCHSVFQDLYQVGKIRPFQIPDFPLFLKCFGVAAVKSEAPLHPKFHSTLHRMLWPVWIQRIVKQGFCLFHTVFLKDKYLFTKAICSPDHPFLLRSCCGWIHVQGKGHL